MKIDFWQVLVGTSIRYLFFAGVAYGFFYWIKRENWWRRKIQPKLPGLNAIRTELLFSSSTIVIFASVIYITMFSPLSSATKIYSSFHDHSLAYNIISFPLVLLLHDTWFYWTHRLMHVKKIFPYVHRVHHLSHNPTPLAAFSFHPLEAMIEIGILPVIAFLLPVHRWVLAFFGLYMIVMNVIGHLGFEIFPKWFLSNPVTRMFTTSTHHNLHHRYSKGNYGLYFSFWDRLLGTYRADYETTYNAIVTGKHADDPVPDVQGKKAVVH